MKTKLKDNKIYRWIMIPICIILCFVGRFIPEVNGFTSDAWGVLFIFIGTLILWLTIGIDWPSLLCIFALGFLDSLSLKDVLKSSFGNDTFLFLMFTFICTYALSKTSLLRRVAITFSGSKVAKKNGYLLIFLFLLSVLILGLFISPTVLFVVMLPILNEILDVSNIEKNDKIAKVMMMGLGFTVSISSGMTPIAHVFPIIALQAAKITTVSMLDYMILAIPTGIILFLLMYGMLILFIKPDVKKLKDNNVSSLKETLPKINAKDIIVLVIFTLVLLLCIIPGFFNDTNAPEVHKFFKNLGLSVAPLFGVVALCIIHVDGKPIIKIDDALKNGVPWASLIMCACTLALGSALGNESIKIPLFLEKNLTPILKGIPVVLVLIIFATWAALQTNLSSNMVTANLVATVASAVLVSVSGANIEAAICIIGMLASFAFATPPSMPHIAIISTSESCNTKDVLLYGGMTMILSIACALLIAYPIGMLIF